MDRIIKLLVIFLLLAFPIHASVEFDNVDDWISLGSDSSIQVSVFTYAAWIKTSTTEATGDNRTIFGSTTNNDGIQFRVNTDEKIGLVKQNTTVIGGSTGNIVNGKWTHVAVTYDNGSGAFIFYINGLDVGSGTSAQTITHAGLVTGSRQGVSNRVEEMPGLIADLAIYNIVLSAEEIGRLGTSFIKRMPLNVRPDALVCYIAIDEGEDGVSADGVIFPDLSGNGNDGTGDNGADDGGLTSRAESPLSYP